MTKPKKRESSDPVMYPSELINLLTYAIQNRMPVLITGKPGQGKTEIMKQVCTALNVRLIIAHPVVDSPIDYKGLGALIDIMIDGKMVKRAEFLPFGDLRQLVESDQPTVHFADDLGPAAKMVQCAYGQLILTGSINSHKIPDNVTFMAATNRKEDKAGVQGVISMLLDRFCTVVELQNSVVDWTRWAAQTGMPHQLISWVRYVPDVLDDFDPTESVKMVRTATPRGLEQVGRWILSKIPDELQLRTFSGAIGKARATEFVGFLRIYESLPNPDEVIMNPKKADIPTEPGSLYALCGALSARATKNNLESLITYADRFKDQEFAVLMVRDCIYRDNMLSKTAAFTNWAIKHEDVLT